MRVDLRRLRPAERFTALGGVVLLTALFLPWYAPAVAKVELERGVFSIGRSVPDAAEKLGLNQQVVPTFTAWQQLELLDLLLVLVALAALGLAVLVIAQRSPAPVAVGEVLLTTLATVAAFAVLYRIVDQPGDDRALDVRYAAWLGFLATAAIARGAWRALRDEGVDRTVEPSVVDHT